MLDLVDLHVAIGIRELGNAAVAKIDHRASDRHAIDRCVGECDRGNRRRHLPVCREREIGVDVLPGHIGAGCVRVDLIKHVPGVGVTRTERGAVDLGPAKLQINRRA